MTNEQLEQQVANTPVSPDEVRELLTRLTEASVESRTVSEARTVAGLALETGLPIEAVVAALGDLRGKRQVRVLRPMFAAMVLAATMGASWWALQVSAPKNDSPLPVVQIAQSQTGPDLTRLVPADSAPFVRGVQAGALADLSFKPAYPLPKGLSISVTSEKVMWGAGDAQSGVIEPLGATELDHVRKNIHDLVMYALRDADQRHLPISPISRPPAQTRVVAIEISTYFGNEITQLFVNVKGKEPTDAATVDKGIDSAIKSLRTTMEQSAKQRRSWGP